MWPRADPVGRDEELRAAVAAARRGRRSEVRRHHAAPAVRLRAHLALPVAELRGLEVGSVCVEGRFKCLRLLLLDWGLVKDRPRFLSPKLWP